MKIIPVIEILKEWSKDYEHPTLRRSSRENNPFKTLISCLLSLRTQDKNTDKTSKALFAVADTPEKILKIPQEKLETLIFSSGYYKNKAKTIKHVSKVILEEYNGMVPEDLESLMSIKGIGRKTATITRVFGFGKADCIPVDVHVFILSNRLGWVKTKTPEKTEEELMKIIPKEYWFEINTLFVLYGKEICQTNSPFCSKCVIRKDCKRIGVKRSR
mgnify:CR=1 FL=1